MNTEVIIAARGELPKNLTKTVDQCAAVARVCVVADGKEKGNEIPAEIVRDGVRLESPWGLPQGCGQARHYGIDTSDADLIVLTDGHMVFPDGWMDEIESFHKHRSNFLTCCQTQSLTQGGEPDGTDPLGAAFIAYKTKEVCQIFWALSAKWNAPAAEPGSVGAVMGACYAFRRKWYEKIGAPLRILRAWGGDEEILSIATHMMGGKVYMLPVTVGHIYMASHTGRDVGADEQAMIWGNRYAIVDAIPMPEHEREELGAWMRQTRRIHNDIPQSPDACDDVLATLATGKKTWQDLKDAEIVRPLTDKEQANCLGREGKQNLADDSKRRTPPQAPADDVAQIIHRPLPKCERCGESDSFRQIRGRKNTGAFGLAYARCSRCGHKAHIRFIE